MRKSYQILLVLLNTACLILATYIIYSMKTNNLESLSLPQSKIRAHSTAIDKLQNLTEAKQLMVTYLDAYTSLGAAYDNLARFCKETVSLLITITAINIVVIGLSFYKRSTRHD